MKRKIISFILMIALMANLLALSGCGKSEDNSNSEVLTRGEWIVILGDAMGMTDYANSESYFSDVGIEDTEFAYVQSCKEWGTLQFEIGEEFRPDDDATKEFVAITAVLASGAMETEGVSENDVLAQAIQLGLIENDRSLSEHVTLSDAKRTAETTTRIYLDIAEEDIVEIDFADGVVDLSALNGISFIDNSTVIVPANVVETIENGAVLIVPGNAMDPFGVAVKVTSITIQGNYATIQTVEPELEEIFDSYKVYGSGVPDLGGLQLADGVTMGNSNAALSWSTADTNLAVNNLVYSGEAVYTEQTAQGISLNFNINFTKGTISVAPQWDDNKVTIERLIPEELRLRGDIGMSPSDDLGKIFEKSNFTATTIPLGVDENGNPHLDSNGMEQVLTVTDKFKGGYTFTGGVSLNNVYVESGFEFKKVIGIPTGIQRAVVELNYESQINANFKGTLSEELTIGSLPIPVAGGLSVKLDLVLYADACGEIVVRAELSNNSKFEYNKGNLKKATTKDASTSVEAAVDLEIGVAPTAILRVLGINVIDVRIKVGVEGNCSAVLQFGQTVKTVSEGNKEIQGYTVWGQVVLETEVSLPVISLEVGTKKTLANKLKITGSWTLVSAEDAPIKWKPELLNHKWILFEIDIMSEIGKDSELDSAGSEDLWWVSDASQLDLKEYSVMLSLNDSPYQLELDLHGASEAPKVIWDSDDTTVVKVDKDGVLSPQGVGLATVTVSLASDPDVFVKCTVFVDGGSNEDWEFLPADMAYIV